MSTAGVTAPALAEPLRRLLRQARPDTVPGGVLAWLGRTDLPNGSTRVPTLGQLDWAGTYMLLENAALAPGIVPPAPRIEALTRDMPPDGPLPIAIASFRMAVPRRELVRRVQAAADDPSQPLRMPRTIANAIEPRRAFAASALLHDQWARVQPVYRGRTVTFLLDERFHLTNPGEPLPDEVQVDVGDGRGFRQVAFGEPFEATCEQGDAAVVALRCRYAHATLTARFRVAVGGPPIPALDETWKLAAGTSTGRADVYRAPGRAAVQHPVILVEGFPGNHPRDYLYEQLNQGGLLEGLRAAGHDVVVVGLDDGMDYIQRNAAVVRACIREAMARTGEPLVVGGVSMGGVLTRYALADMEQRGEPHNTRLYVSVDAPHGGSSTSLGVQWFVHSMLPFAPGLGGFAQLLDSPANQQLLIAWLGGDGEARTSPLRRQLLADLERLGGYPSQPRRIAASCGRADGTGVAAPGQQTLEWDADPFVSATLRTLPGDANGVVAEGSWFLDEPPQLRPLVDRDGVPWESAPGGQDAYNAQVAAIAAGIGCGNVAHQLDITCCVPTVSALDLRQDPLRPVPDPSAGASPFHAYACSAQNQMHLAIEPALAKWLLDEIGPPGADGRDG